MKFIISKTSGFSFNTDNPPYEGARHEIETRKRGDGSEYTNDYWVIEVSTLKDLLNISKVTQNELVVSCESYRGDGPTPSIEIYDTYRE